MNEIKITNILRHGESETIEFKETFDIETVETAGAFVNTKGGIILIGVSDKGKIQGVQVGTDTINKWVNQISDSSNPRIIPEIKCIEVKGRTVVTISIKEFPIKPVAIKGRHFKRIGKSNRIMTAQEVAQQYLASAGSSWDKLPVKDATFDDMDIDRIKKYIIRANESGRRKIAIDESPRQVLEKLELMKEGHPTWAALLLFGKGTSRMLTQAVIHCGRFKEETVIVDDRLIEGSIIEQIDEAMDFVRKNINVRFVMTGKPERKEIWDYPLEALREAIVNAVCHRDYLISSNTEIRIYDDKLIVWNPGGLPEGITIKDLYKSHSSVLRNKGIAMVLYDIGLIEQWGSGIDKMRKACTESGLPDPQLEEHQGFRIIFRKDIFTEEYLRELGLNERQLKAVQYVKEKENIINKEYRELFNITDRTALRDLNLLCRLDVFVKSSKIGKATTYNLSRHLPDKPDTNPT